MCELSGQFRAQRSCTGRRRKLPSAFCFVPTIVMEANQSTVEILESFSLEPFFVDVLENSTTDVDEHRFSVGISVIGEDGKLACAFNVCSSHVRELAQTLERAANCAERRGFESSDD